MERLTHFLLFLALLAISLTAPSCSAPSVPKPGADDTTDASSTAAEPTETAEPGLEDSVALTKNGITPFLIIRSAEFGSREKALAENVQTAIAERFGIRIPSVTDNSPAAEKSRGYEILIGRTNRPESMSAAGRLRFRDWSVSREGDRILLSGDADSMLAYAVDAFLDGLRMVDGEVYATCWKTVTGSYPVPEMTVNGTPLAEWRIVYADGNSLASDMASRVAELLRDETGWTLDCLPDTLPATAREILVGATNRAESGTVRVTLTDGEGAMRTEGGKPVLIWSDPYATDGLLTRLSGDLLADRKSATHDLARFDFRVGAGEPVPLGAAQLTVMSFNILGVGSGKTSPYNRDDLTAAVIRSYLPDLIGLQEFDAPFRLAEKNLFRLLGETYAEAVCAGTEPDRNWNPILYRPDRFDLIACGNQAFSRGTEWSLPASYPSDSKTTHHRTLTWAVFRLKETGRVVILLNAHYHVDSRMTAAESEEILADEAREVAEKANELALAYPGAVLFAVGDYNSTSSGRVMRTLVEGGFTDAWDSAKRKTDVCGFHAPPVFNAEQQRYDGYDASFPLDGYRHAVDHCAVRGEDLTVCDYRSLTLRDALLVSDHCPLLCRVYLKGD